MFSPEALQGWMSLLTVQVTETNKEAGQRALVAEANRAFHRVMSNNPAPTGWRQFVDGVEGAPVAAVRYDGVIIYVWQYLQEIVRRCFESLVMNSPVVSGDYILSIAILLDDDESKVGSKIEDITANTKKVTLVPTADYARRLEVGLNADQSPFVVQVPLHNVELVAVSLRRRFGTLADISFNYVDISPAYALKHNFQSRRRYAHETHVRYPAIVIVPKTG